MAIVFADSYGYNVNDATNALQAAINDSSAGQIIIRNMGTPWQISQTIFLRSNKELIFEPGVVVQARAGSFVDNTRPMFRVVNVENVKFTGLGDGAQQATLRMNRADAGNAENGHILSFNGARNYEVSGLRLFGAGDDAIYIAGADSRNFPGVLDYSENGVIENVIADSNRRQGLSII
jgi:hypothetical protein